jgi:hypothetical protein
MKSKGINNSSGPVNSWQNSNSLEKGDEDDEQQHGNQESTGQISKAYYPAAKIQVGCVRGGGHIDCVGRSIQNGSSHPFQRPNLHSSGARKLG